MNTQYLSLIALFLTLSRSTVEGEKKSMTTDETLEDFIKKELSSIRIKISCSIPKAAYLESRKKDLIEKIAFYQGKDMTQYNSEDIKNFSLRPYETYCFFKCKKLDTMIHDKILASSELKKQIKKRYPNDGLFHYKNNTFFNIKLIRSFADFIKDDECIRNLEDFILDKLAYKLVENFGFDVLVYDKVLNRKKDGKQKGKMQYICACMVKEYEEYVNNYDFTRVVDKMIEFFINYYNDTFIQTN